MIPSSAFSGNPAQPRLGRAAAAPLAPNAPFLLPVPLRGFDRPSLETANAVAARTGARWFVLHPAGAAPSPRLAEALARAALQRPDVEIFYADDTERRVDRVQAKGLHFKPEFNPALLLAYDYVRWPLLVRRDVFAALDGLDPRAASAAGYDLVLRAFATGRVIGRIPEILLTGTVAEPTIPEDARRALAAHVERGGEPLDLRDGRRPGTFEIRRRFTSHPDVTLLVPTCQSPGRLPGAPPGPQIVRLLESLCRSTWPADRLRVLVADDLEDGSAYLGRDWPFRVDRFVTRRAAGEAFNYAAKMNRLWRRADTEHVVLMNDDIEILSPDWLEALMTFAVARDVGGVGGRLLLPDGRLQHAGMVGGVLNTVAHPWYARPSDAPTYGHWADVHRDWSMVTGAVFATRRSVLEEVAGFDERLTLEYNDVDLCLRIGLMGRRVVYTPHAECIHHEMVSRGRKPPPAREVALFRRRWRAILEDDPAFHPELPHHLF